MSLGNNLKKPGSHSPEGTVEEEQANVPEQNSEGEHEAEQEDTEELINYTQYCIFNAGKEEYAIPIDIVKEVVKYSIPAPLPQMPDYITGMSNIRGNIYGVMDLEMFFQGESKEEQHKYLLVLDHETFKMAIRISNVPNSIMVSDEEVEELNSNSLKSTMGQKHLKGIIKKEKRMIIVIDIVGVVSGETFTKIET